MVVKCNPEKNILNFRKKVLLRSKNTIYYGNRKDRFIVKVNIKSSHDMGELKIADKVSIMLLDTAPGINENKRIIKMSDKNGLYDALNIGEIWLKKALEFST